VTPAAGSSSDPSYRILTVDEAIHRYTKRAFTTAGITAELVKLAKEMHKRNDRHNQHHD
jgi:hypothetical protein